MERDALKLFTRLALASMVAWVVGALFVVPQLIRWGYSGEAFTLLNNAFSGRDVHPVTFYLEAWRQLARLASVLLLLAAAILGWWTVFPRNRREAIDRALGGKDGLTPGTILGFAFAAGLLGGVAEALYLGARQLATTRPAALFHMEIYWMAPLSAGAATLLFGLALAALSMGGRGRMSLSRAALLFGFLVIHGVVQSEGIPLHPAAELLASLGLASVLARAISDREARVLPLFRRLAPAYLVGVVWIVGAAWFTHPGALERRILRSAPIGEISMPNLLVIILDTARAASFSLYGYDRPTSPEIDEWAKAGTVFDRAMATSSWTLPSHASLFTGEYHQVAKTSPQNPLSGDFLTLAEVLAGRGYATAGFAANPMYTTSSSGLAQGFARYEDRPWDLANFVWSSWLSRTFIGRPLAAVSPRLWPRTATAVQITDEFLDWMQHRDEDRPFFAFLNYFDAHEGYFAPDSVTVRFGPLPTQSFSDFKEEYHNGSYSELDRWVNKYDASIAHIDHHIGIIRRELARSGLLENTIVVIASDHGESWGEHGQLGHYTSLYLPEVHIPLLISFPGTVPAGERIEAVVSLRDIPRTVGALAGVAELASFPGRSLHSTWSAAPPHGTEYALTEVEPTTLESPRAVSPLSRGPIKSLVEGSFQYITNGDGEEELYDITSDAQEERDLSGNPQYADVLARFRSALDSMVSTGRYLRGRPTDLF